MINLNEIRCVDNRELSRDAIGQLAANIGNVGLLQPLLLRRIEPTAAGERYEVLAGRRRYRALLLLERYELADPDYRILDTDEPELISFVENFERKNLTLWEEVDQLRVLTGKYSAAELATLLGRSEKYVRLRLKLAELHPELRRNVAKYPRMTAAHWEAVAAFPPSCQKEIPERLLESPFPVSGMKIELEERFMALLSRAAFDTSGCENCPNRSDSEPWLFEELKDADRVRCLDAVCFQHRTAGYIKELAREAEKRGLRLVATDEPLPKELKRLKYTTCHEYELPEPCDAETADLLVIWGGSAGKFFRKRREEKAKKSDEPPMSAPERAAAKRKKLARLKFAARLAGLEQLPPTPPPAKMIKLAGILGVGWIGEHYELKDIDAIDPEEIADKIWCKCVSEFARRANFAKNDTLARQDTANDEAAARLCGLNWSEFADEAAAEIPDAE